MRAKTGLLTIAGIYLLTACAANAAAPAEPETPEVEAAMEAQAVTAEAEIEAVAAEVTLDPEWYIPDLPLSCAEQEALWEACQEFQVDHAIMLSLVERESNFRNIRGDGGDSIGYCQIQPRWWSGLMAEIGAEDLTDPEDNFRTACAILAELTERYGNVEDALSAYNTGKPGHTEYAAAVIAGMEDWKNDD